MNVLKVDVKNDLALAQRLNMHRTKLEMHINILKRRVLPMRLVLRQEMRQHALAIMVRV